jgi:uncharacterized membrane protein YGL010W
VCTRVGSPPGPAKFGFKEIRKRAFSFLAPICYPNCLFSTPRVNITVYRHPSFRLCKGIATLQTARYTKISTRMSDRTNELRQLLSAFGATHQNPINLMLHVLTFPFLIGSAAMLLGCSGSLFPLPTVMTDAFPEPVRQYMVLSAGALMLFIYSGYYMYYDFFAGGLYALCIAFPAWIVGQAILTTIPHAWALALGIHLLGWCVQAVGHRIEGSSLAMHDTTNKGRPPLLVGAIAMFPFSLWACSARVHRCYTLCCQMIIFWFFVGNCRELYYPLPRFMHG